MISFSIVTLYWELNIHNLMVVSIESSADIQAQA